MRKRDCETGQLIGEPWKGERYILAIALSPDGKTIACGRSDGSVGWWDTIGQMKEDIQIGRVIVIGCSRCHGLPAEAISQADLMMEQWLFEK